MEDIASTVLLYEDTGTSNVDILSLALKAAFGSMKSKLGTFKYHLLRVSANDIIHGGCLTDANIFVMPGGRDLPYVAKLQGSGIENLRRFVENGGRYFGICAGAYFASSFCEFEKGSDMEVCGQRDMKLYPGTALGCIYPGFQYGSENGARMINVILTDKFGDSVNNRKFPVYYNGGCEFILQSQSELQEVENVARYEDFPDKNAIVLCKHGDGKILLSGVHPEMNSAFIKDKSKYNSEQLQVMSAKSQEQQKLLGLLLEMLLV